MTPTEERQKLEEQVEGIEAFILSPAHKSYVHTQRVDLGVIEEQILTTAPTIENISPLNQLHGERTLLLKNITFFEDARRNLKEEISRLCDIENETANNKQ